MRARLLIVDDEVTIRHFLVRILEREGYDVLAAADGMEALNLLALHPIDLLLTDIRMDRLNGVALLEEAKIRYPNMIVILLTGYATVETAVTALRHKASNYLLKPIKNEELIAAVELGLNERQREQRRDRIEQLATHFSSVMLNESEIVLPVQSSRHISCGLLSLDTTRYAASLNQQPLNLTPTEFRLLSKLARVPGETFDYVTLVHEACGYMCLRQEAQEIIGTHIRNLRQKLGVDTDQPLYIESIRSIGYRLIPPKTTD